MTIQRKYKRLALVAVMILSSMIITGCVELIYMPMLSAIPLSFESRYSAWENRCKLTLRALGSSELAYADTNLNKAYGTWESLQESEYIQKGYTRANIVDNYSLCTFYADQKHFYIIAVPSPQKMKLRTFAISDDQTPRVWVGKDSEFSPTDFDFGNPAKWEPLR
jgi:hypothetical protein